MADGDLTDVWSMILRECATDDRPGLRNMAVPALAHVATYRALCREIREAAARLATPYDATIEFVSNGRSRVPIAFCGGVHFAETRFESGISIIRDRATSQMFAVSHGDAEHHPDWGDGGPCWVYTVKRMYPLARLAQLLGGHASTWSEQLPDLFQVALPPTGASGDWYRQTHVSMRNHSLTPGSRAHRGVVAKNQLRGREWTGEAGRLLVHGDDFFSHKVVDMWTGGYRRFTKTADFVLVECVEGGCVNDVMRLPKRHNWCGNDHTKLGIRSPSVFSVLPHDDDVHGLSRALGWDCAPRVAEGPGWLVSKFAHNDAGLIQATPTDHVPAEDLMYLCHLAKVAREAEDQARTRPYHATKNPLGFDVRLRARRRPRPKRAAARAAMTRMHELDAERQRLDVDLSTSSDEEQEEGKEEGEDPPPPPPSPKRRRAATEGDADDGLALARQCARLRAVWDAMRRGELTRLLEQGGSLRVV